MEKNKEETGEFSFREKGIENSNSSGENNSFDYLQMLNMQANVLEKLIKAKGY